MLVFDLKQGSPGPGVPPKTRLQGPGVPEKVMCPVSTAGDSGSSGQWQQMMQHDKRVSSSRVTVAGG